MKCDERDPCAVPSVNMRSSGCALGGRECGGDRSPVLNMVRLFLLRLRKYQASAAPSPRTKTAPTTPPIIDPRFGLGPGTLVVVWSFAELVLIAGEDTGGLWARQYRGTRGAVGTVQYTTRETSYWSACHLASVVIYDVIKLFISSK